MESLTPPPSAGRASVKELILPPNRLRADEPTPPSTPTDSFSRRSLLPSPISPSTPDSIVLQDDILVFPGAFVMQPAFAVGAWSEVHSAVNKADRLDASAVGERVYAVKTPLHSLARAVLRREARILTRLHTYARAWEFTVAFHGFCPATNAVVLGMGGPSLATAIAAQTAAVRRQTINQEVRISATDPVIGAEAWTRLATHLLQGLAWLHSAGVVHGDIKPANILMSRLDVEGDWPVYCDFSSSRLISDSPAPLPSDAVTTAYASPELLASLVPPSQGIPTEGSDRWALAVTLLAAATGEEPYAAARSALQRLAMARSGIALDMARGGDQGQRAKKGGLASRCLEGAMRRKETERWSTREWLKTVEQEHHSWERT